MGVVGGDEKREEGVTRRTEIANKVWLRGVCGAGGGGQWEWARRVRNEGEKRE